MQLDELLSLASDATSESAAIDFKSAFDSASRGEWCELIKDMVAMANSGGGCIVLGVGDDGERSAWDPTPINNLDPAQIGDQLRKYADGLADSVSMRSVVRGSDTLPALVVAGSPVPRVFSNPGNYDKGGGKQTQAFPKGGLYYRHGAKSEPAEQADVAASIERATACLRSTWLSNIRQVMEAPPGSRVQIVTSEVRASADPSATAVRIVDDSNAPAYRIVNPDDTHPYRQKELVTEVNKRMDSTKINGFDVQCVRRMLDGDTCHPEFFHEPKYGSKQYSAAFVDFIVDACGKEAGFLAKARNAAKTTKA